MFKLAIRSEALLKTLQSLPKSKQWLFAKLDSLEDLSNDSVVEQVYRQVSNSSGITKQTHRGRFADLNAMTLKLIKTHKLKHIHDVGVSSGITSVELFELLQDVDVSCSLSVSDKYARYYRYSCRPGTCIADADSRLVAAYWGCIYADAAVSAKYPISRWLYNRARRCEVPESKESFLLFHPELLGLIRDGKVMHIDFDILSLNSAAKVRFDYIRCMNLLNQSYFDEDELFIGLNTLAETLSEGGILQIGRSDQTTGNNVSFYQRRNDRLELVDTYQEGCEITDTIRRFNTRPATTSCADSA